MAHSSSVTAYRRGAERRLGVTRAMASSGGMASEATSSFLSPTPREALVSKVRMPLSRNSLRAGLGSFVPNASLIWATSASRPEAKSNSTMRRACSDRPAAA